MSETIMSETMISETLTASGNQDQSDYWNGPTGHKWALLQERIDRSFAPLTAALVAGAAPRAGERAFDIGCGCGDLALALARAVGPTGHVTGLDISRPMLDQARRRVAFDPSPLAPLAFTEADASVARFAPEADLMASRFGVMFFDDPARAFANLRGALRPGGRLAMLCWRPLAENDWATVPCGPIVAVAGAPEPSPPGTPGPFALSDPSRTKALLAAAGFTDIGATPVDADMRVGEARDGRSALDDAVDYLMQIGPAARLLRELPDEIAVKVRDDVRHAVAAHEREDGVYLGAACWLYRAVTP